MDDIDRLIAATRDRHLSVRRAAIRALGDAGDVRAVRPLINALNGPEQVVRQSAIEALIRIGKPSVTPLTIALTDDRSAVRRAAAEALGEIGDSKAIAPLLNLLNDDSADVRSTAAKALEITHWHPPSILKENAPMVVCPECFCRFEERYAKLGLRKKFSCYMCRSCNGLSTIDSVAKVAAVLDLSLDMMHKKEGTTLIVNWHLHKDPFDFDEVRIKDASDFDIDELVMRLKNDMDDKRRKRYRTIPVYV